ncbi:MAG: N-acetylmuramoyl-L-alanine amidase [Sphingomonadales bacterium]|jgi:N-acetylmuramoyl-L-alanine amidase|nr:N-acetylmuramoyl-L-alanine amidase [Sphingomonadales bacterium]MEA3044250.1 N-acetylmuramoyl-L-alanine amidase [Sphingomonadales bacterium]MEA3047624.1 N-acetylmuramoyl-L-alanine amidase [Sphingomonadales bacterium]
MEGMIDSPSPNFDARDQAISMVVLHYTGMQDAESAIARLRDPEARVSAHYLIAEDGQILRMVDEANRAWHAGLSYWRGVSGVNGCSVGIEIVNPGHEYGYRPFTDEQMESLIPLLADIADRHQVPRANIVGHSDVAPARKQDPGELFDWARLARHGLAVARPSRDLIDPHWTDGGFLLALERYGYDVRESQKAVIAFQRRFRPEMLDGTIDGECRAILLQLLLERERGHVI